MLSQPGDEAAAAVAERDGLPPLFGCLEVVVSDSGVLVGDRVTLAGIALGASFASLGGIAVAIGGTRSRRPTSCLAAIPARPSFARVIEADRDVAALA